jgi:hypothetical protein
VAGVVVAAGVDAARDLELELADIALTVGVGEAQRNRLRHRDRAGIGEAAIVEAGAGDDVGDQVEVGVGQIPPRSSLPQRVQVGPCDMREHDVLRVGDAQFVEAVLSARSAISIGSARRSIAGDAADGLRLIVTIA